jgi:hypothetical protein
MQSIEYYSISDLYDDERLPDPLLLKYSSKEKAIEVAINNYKPRFRLDDVHHSLRLNGAYQIYNCSLNRFIEAYSDDFSGYYELSIGETQHTVKDSSIEFFAELFILFTEAKKVYTPEIKVAGQPYQPAKKEIKTIRQIGPLPLYKCKKYSDSYIYGVESNMDNWYKTSKATIQDNLYINHDTIEIH